MPDCWGLGSREAKLTVAQRMPSGPVGGDCARRATVDTRKDVEARDRRRQRVGGIVAQEEAKQDGVRGRRLKMRHRLEW